jgi:hypothetical protein
MNCKPGDLAIRIKVFPKSTIPLGAVVRVVESSPWPYVSLSDGSVQKAGHVWVVEFRGAIWGMPDDHITPIQDNHGEDETLQWAPVPVKEAA